MTSQTADQLRLPIPENDSVYSPEDYQAVEYPQAPRIVDLNDDPEIGKEIDRLSHLGFNNPTAAARAVKEAGVQLELEPEPRKIYHSPPRKNIKKNRTWKMKSWADREGPAHERINPYPPKKQY